MKTLKLEVDINRLGLKGMVFNIIDKMSNRLEKSRIEKAHQNRLNNVFKEPETPDRDQIIDELAQRYWNRFDINTSRGRHDIKENRKSICRTVTDARDRGSHIRLTNIKLKKEFYPYICAHIKCARELGLDTDIPFESQGTIVPHHGFDCNYDMVVIPIQGKLKKL